MSDTRTINEHYAEVANDLLQTEEALEYIRNSSASIIYLSSEAERKSKNKITHAECEKVPVKYKWSITADFTITVFEPNVKDFTEEQIRILLFHELLHVGIEVNDGDEKYFIKPHDLEDFKLIIDKFGTEWSWTN